MSILWLIAGWMNLTPSDWPGYMFWLVFALLCIADEIRSHKR